MAVFSVTEAMVAWIASLGYQASNDVPADPMPDEFVTVGRMGGPVESWVDHPSMAVRCWALTHERAEAMALALRRDLIARRPPAGIHSVRVDAGPYPVPDEYTRRPCEQVVYDLTSQLEI